MILRWDAVKCMSLFRNKYRVETTRLQNWDYSSDGAYFITICTKDREHIFGTIELGRMKLTQHRKIVEQCWYDLPNHYYNLILGEFVVMPNHVHGIMIIDNSRYGDIVGTVYLNLCVR
jgi:REP element-mobilizing transposase RayT